MIGLLGQQARESLLLCVSLSSKNQALEQYISHHSNFCTILATGQSTSYVYLARNADPCYCIWFCWIRLLILMNQNPKILFILFVLFKLWCFQQCCGAGMIYSGSYPCYLSIFGNYLKNLIINEKEEFAICHFLFHSTVLQSRIFTF